MIFEKLGTYDKNTLLNYIKEYAAPSDDVKIDVEQPLSYILRFWDSAKENLYHVFNDNFIISKTIDIPFDVDGIEKAIYHKFFVEQGKGKAFVDSFIDFNDGLWFGSIGKKYNFEEDSYKHNGFISSNLNKLISSECLSKNIYTGSSFELPSIIRRGKFIKINKGMKTIKALGKIAKEYDLAGFEDFRIEHSMILNSSYHRNITINLSIHPMDFITMSDNWNGWESCMSWFNKGGYRQGTVECMNSDCVVVAYVSDKTMHGDEWSWNSKSWRELFICSPNLITGIKGYPYKDETLETIIVDWLAELMKANGYSYYQNRMLKIVGDYDTFEIEDSLTGEAGPNLNIITNAMYCDFCTNNTIHYTKLGATIPYSQDETIEVYYSGASECMICGRDISDYDFYNNDENQDLVICNECNVTEMCDDCGYYFDAASMEYLGDMQLCPECFERNSVECICCGNLAYRGSCETISAGKYVIDKNEFEFDPYEDPAFICPDCAYEQRVLNEDGKYCYRRKMEKIFKDIDKVYVVKVDWGFYNVTEIDNFNKEKCSPWEYNKLVRGLESKNTMTGQIKYTKFKEEPLEF